MKTQITLFLSIVLLLYSCTISQNLNNKKACRKFEKQMKIVDKFLNGEFENKNTFPVHRAIVTIEITTEIERQAPPWDDYDIYNTSKIDYDIWDNWFKTNKDSLTWNKKSRTIELLKDS